jgi:hypothetical protein
LLKSGFLVNPSQLWSSLVSKSETEGGLICKERSGKVDGGIIIGFELRNMMEIWLLLKDPPSSQIEKTRKGEASVWANEERKIESKKLWAETWKVISCDYIMSTSWFALAYIYSERERGRGRGGGGGVR